MRGSFSGLNVNHIGTITRYPEETGQLFRIVPQEFGCILTLSLDFHFNTVAGKPHPNRKETELRRLQLEIQNSENASRCSRSGYPIQTIMLNGWLLRLRHPLDIIDDGLREMLEC